jgi:hypothetical protein
MKRRTHDILAVTLGTAALLVIAGLCMLWLTVEVWTGIIMFNIGQPFLGGCMLAIAAGNALFGLSLIVRELR